MKTLKELAQEALDVQDACNLCGVAQSFARAMRDLCEHTKSTEERNTHPVTIMWLDKMNSLAGIQFDAHFTISKAYDFCRCAVEKEEGDE